MNPNDNKNTYPTTNTYRYSPEYIHKATRAFKFILYIGVGLGLVLGAVGIGGIYEGNPPVWLGILVGILIGGGVLIPLFGSAWMGGESIRKHGGWVGILFVLGILSLATGLTYKSISYLFPVGIAVTVIAIILLFVIGIAAKVPIWFGLPTLNSPRVYLTRGKDDKNPKK